MKELKVKRIESGTVIDHIPPGQAPNVLKILGIRGGSKEVVSMVMNVVGKTGKKDIVKIENRELAEDELDQIALIAPNATINIIRDYEVVEKYKVTPHDFVEGVVKCSNPNCISNTNEPIVPKFLVERKKPVVLRCMYCERKITEDIAKYLI
ncbi:aspartate carbamoyltransferase regulatory subunit [Methanosarcinales archaeon]|nr:MAG: aspartate carbamoyltransferase regulatory subunit [Methanosarcinales archaeon]